MFLKHLEHLGLVSLINSLVKLLQLELVLLGHQGPLVPGLGGDQGWVRLLVDQVFHVEIDPQHPELLAELDISRGLAENCWREGFSAFSTWFLIINSN